MWSAELMRHGKLPRIFAASLVGLALLAFSPAPALAAAEPPEPIPSRSSTQKTAEQARIQCEELTQKGERTAALDACRQALTLLPDQANLRALVAAQMHAGGRPTPSQLIEVAMVIKGMRRTAPRGVYTIAAECDLYLGLGNWPALDDCARQLRELYPGHTEARRVSALLGDRRAKWYVAAAWWGLLLVVAGGLLQTFWRRSTQLRRKALMRAMLLITLGMLFVPEAAHGQGEPKSPAIEAAPTASTDREQISRFQINPADPEASIPSDAEKNRDPLQFGYLLMDLTDQAEAANKVGDHAKAIRFYRALAKAVPDRAISFSKLCTEYQAAGDLQRAIDACRSALTLGGVTIQDHLRFVDLALQIPGQVNPETVTAIDEVVKHLAREAKDSPYAASVECKLGLRLQDPVRMKHCTEQLSTQAPRDPQAVTYQWAYAIMRKDFRAAQAFLQEAKAIDLGPTAIHNMEEATERAVPWLQRLAPHAWLIATMLVMGLFACAVWFAARKRNRLSRVAL